MDKTEIKTLSNRKLAILEAAQRLFGKKGYAASSMRDLAKELKIKPASLYSHYDSKEDILWEIAVRCARDFRENVLPHSDSEKSIEDRMEKMIHEHIRVIIRNIDAAAIFFTEWRLLGDEKRKEYRLLIKQYEGGFSSVIQEGIRKGVFRPVSTDFITIMILSSVNWIHKWYRPEGNMSVEAICKHSSDFVLSGLKA